jgi:predicted enzyme related to lactoylglutathione lyase
MTELFAGIPVTRLDRAFEFYEHLVGSPPDFFPNDNEAVWRLGPAWIYVVGDAERAGNGLLTVLVDDLDRQVAELAERGLKTGPIETVPDTVRTAAITDPDGNRTTFGQPLGENA